MKVLPYGEDGAYVDLEAGDAPDRAPRTHALAAALRAAFPDADVVTGAGVVAVFGAQASAVETTLTGLRVTSPDAYTSSPDAYTSPRNVYASSPNVYTSTVAPRSHVIDVAYDGPDLDDIAARTGLSRAAVIDLHTGREHVVELIGFLPGFAYMGPVDPRLVLPRRPAPRPRVEAGTVAIAGAFTGIYPLASPGGWNLLGASHGPRPFDPSRADPFLFSPGDRVRFRSSVSLESVAPPVSPAAPAASAPHAPSLAAPRANPAAHALIIARAAGIATLQDAGRTGLLGKGMPPSGPLDPPLFLAANRAAGNPPGAAAIELLAGSLVLRARGTVGLSIDGAPARALREGEELHIPEGPFAVRYIAVTGGIAVPLVLGARATLLTARIGGIAGRPLRNADILPILDPALIASPAALSAHAASLVLETLHASDAPPALIGIDSSLVDPTAPLLVDPGPHLDRFPPEAFDRLLTTDWHISPVRDRTGARLAGPPIPRTGPDLAAPVPMRRGAIQITTDGTPIVLGPDHPTTGGYPVLAVVCTDSLGPLARKRPGALVRFSPSARRMLRSLPTLS